MEGRRAIVSRFHRKSGFRPGHVSVSNINDDVSSPPIPNVSEGEHKDTFSSSLPAHWRESLYIKVP